MKYEAYEKIIAQCLKDPDKFGDCMESLLENIKKDTEYISVLEDKTRQQEDKIGDLRDTNTKLLLSQLSPKDNTEEEPELTGDEEFEKFINEITKGE